MQDLTGKTFGRLTVIGLAPRTSKNRHWHCVCACGTKRVVIQYYLSSGHTLSCGCLRRETAWRTHGLSKTRTHRIWCNMKTRCHNSRTRCFPRYGGRRITVCTRWSDSFSDFLSDMGIAPAGMQLDRIDNDGNYEPANCRWTTPSENCRNKRINRILRIGNETMPLIVAAERFGVDANMVRIRLNKGWPDELAVLGPRLPTGPRPRSGYEKLPR